MLFRSTARRRTRSAVGVSKSERSARLNADRSSALALAGSPSQAPAPTLPSPVGPAPAPSLPVESVKFGELVFHIARAELRRGDDVVHLTDRERDMLRVLAAEPGATVPRMALAGTGGQSNERAVDVQVNRLRRKIERDPANPLIIQTVRGIGYRLMVSP